MLWYYAEGRERHGPVEQSEIIRLLKQGHLTNSSLVWNSTLAAWTPIAGTNLPSEAHAAPAQLTCIVTGKTFPEAEMLRTEHGWVSAEGKDSYYQALREGVAPVLASNATSARRDGNRIVVPASAPRLPARCVKTNRMVSASEIRSKKLYWVHPAVYLSLLLNILVLLVLSLVLRKKLVVDIPLCTEARQRLRTNAVIATAGALAGIALVVVGIAGVDSGELIWLLPIGLLVLIGSLVFANLKATALRVTRMRQGYAWISGACSEYLDSLPPHSG